jgi:hypothetical protein
VSHRQLRSVVLRLASLALAAGLAQTAPASAQIPDTFTNLQVLPKEISRRDLVATMRGIASDLGVRCDHCHVEAAGKLDFANDALATKKAARQMLLMTRTINADYVSRLPGDDSQRLKVTCVTCHRGQSIPPRPLDAIVVDTATKSGPAAAVAKYQQLKKEAPDSGLYDFRARSIVLAAGRLRDDGRMDDAIALMREGSSLFPDSAQYVGFLGQLCLQKGDLDCADQSLARAQGLDPSDENVKRAIEQLKTKRSPK